MRFGETVEEKEREYKEVVRPGVEVELKGKGLSREKVEGIEEERV